MKDWRSAIVVTMMNVFVEMMKSRMRVERKRQWSLKESEVYIYWTWLISFSPTNTTVEGNTTLSRYLLYRPTSTSYSVSLFINFNLNWVFPKLCENPNIVFHPKLNFSVLGSIRSLILICLIIICVFFIFGSISNLTRFSPIWMALCWFMVSRFLLIVYTLWILVLGFLVIG
jgi:hypothetical protein